MKTTLTDNTGTARTTIICDHCHNVIVPNSPHSTGYGTNEKGQSICFACCGKIDREALYNLPLGGKYILYDHEDRLTNWPGTLTIETYRRKVGRHNLAGKRYDMWFSLPGQPTSHAYHAVRYGDTTQIAHVRRIKD